MRTEISQAKREADFFKGNVERSKRMTKNKGGKVKSSAAAAAAAATAAQKKYEFKQKETDEMIR